MKPTILTTVALAGALTSAVVQAAPQSYLGAWTITGAVLAPWADPARPLDPAEPARLKGKTVTFKAHAISGPQPLACPGAHYRRAEFTAGLLFQGAFDEMRSRDHHSDPDRIAASLGFKGRQISTLETGCEFDFHFIDAATAEFGLNDYVYTLRRK